MSDKKNNSRNAIVVVFLALFAVLLIAEVGLRLVAQTNVAPALLEAIGRARPPLDTRTGPGLYYAHHYSAYAMKPNYERPGFEKINSLGFRGEDISLEKPDGVYRIVALGGSTTFAVYLPWNNAYPYYLQRELRERFGTDKIEVINGGLTGSTSAESFHRLATQVLPLDPDMVIVYHAYNDLLPRVFNGYSDDYYHFRKSDPNNPPGMTRFYLYRLALAVLSPGFFHENYNLMGRVWKIENLPSTDTERTQNFLNSNNDAFRFNMDNLVTLLRAKDIEVVLASFAMSADAWHWMDYLPPYLWEVGIKDNNSAIAELAAQHDVPMVPFATAPFLKASEVYKAKMYADSIHMSPAGNEFKAEIFADTIAPIIAEKLGMETPEPSQYVGFTQNSWVVSPSQEQQ